MQGAVPTCRLNVHLISFVLVVYKCTAVSALHTHYDAQRIFLLATAGTLATNHHGLSIANRYLLLLRFHLCEHPASRAASHRKSRNLTTCGQTTTNEPLSRGWYYSMQADTHS